MATVPIQPAAAAATRAGAALRNIPSLLQRLLTKPARLAEQFVDGLTNNGGKNFRLRSPIHGRGTSQFTKIEHMTNEATGKNYTLEELKEIYGDSVKFVPPTRKPTGRFETGGHYVNETFNLDGPMISNNLTREGMAVHGAGYLAGFGAPAGLGYAMFGGDKEEKHTDSNGVKNPNYDMDAAKRRTKFSQDYLGGSKAFSKPIYDMALKKNPWVKTAIEGMGVDAYKGMRKQLATGEIQADDFHHQLVNLMSQSGDEDVMKQMGNEAYVLPGIYKNPSGKAKYIVMNPMKQKDGTFKHEAMQFDISDLPNQGEAQQGGQR